MTDELTDEQKALAERNRQRAILIRAEKQSKMSVRECDVYMAQKNANKNIQKKMDSNGGFLLDDCEKPEPNRKRPTPSTSRLPNELLMSICVLCKQQFMDSFLKENFDYLVCDVCRKPKEDHTLITRTEAKTRYLLKDCDLDLRPPPLRFITKRNRKEGFNKDMKLYLQLQVEERALEVWGSEEKILEEMETREKRNMQQKDKKYRREMKNLRRQVQAQNRVIREAHVHEYGEEVYDEKDDIYKKTCDSCSHTLEYEKM